VLRISDGHFCVNAMPVAATAVYLSSTLPPHNNYTILDSQRTCTTKHFMTCTNANILLPISLFVMRMRLRRWKTVMRQNLLHCKLLKTETRYVEQGGHAYKCEPSPEQQRNWHSVFEPRWGKNVISLRSWAGTRHKHRSKPEAGQEHMERKRGRVCQRQEKGEIPRRKK
jgi:hypothetical protein